MPASPFRLGRTRETRARRFLPPDQGDTGVKPTPKGGAKRPFEADKHERSLPSTMTANDAISPFDLDKIGELPSFAVQDDGKSKFNF
jgi:hypothetical protein